MADEGREDSDDGDNEGNELQYDSDVSSEDEIDLTAKYDVKGLSQFSHYKTVFYLYSREQW